MNVHTQFLLTSCIFSLLGLQHEHPGQVCQQPIFSLITHHSLSPPVATSCPLISPATTVPYHSPSHTTTITTELPHMKTSFSHTGAALGKSCDIWHTCGTYITSFLSIKD